MIPVMMQTHTDFLCPFQTPDTTLTRRNQVLRDDDIFSKVEQKTNTQNGRLLSFLLTFDPDTWQTNTVIFSEFNWKIVFSKITSRISKPLSVFDKLGLGSKYRGADSVSAHRVEKNATSQGILDQAGKKRELQTSLNFSRLHESQKLLLRLAIEETSEISGWL